MKWTEAEYLEYTSKVPEDESLEQMRARAWRGPVPPGFPPHDQPYICPICETRFPGYRRGMEPPGAAIIQRRPTSPRDRPRQCCGPKCYAVEWESHSKMCQEHWAAFDAERHKQKKLFEEDQKW